MSEYPEMNRAKYDEDIVLWANEQAALLRSGQFHLLDIEHLADEIEDVGKAERREFANCLSTLLSMLLIWQHEPKRRSGNFDARIRLQREQIACHLEDTPSLQQCLANANWLKMVWSGAIVRAIAEAWPDNLPESISDFPDQCPWQIDDVMKAHRLIDLVGGDIKICNSLLQ